MKNNKNQYRVELYIESDIPLNKQKAKDYVSRIKYCFSPQCHNILKWAIHNKSSGDDFSQIKFKGVYIKEY